MASKKFTMTINPEVEMRIRELAHKYGMATSAFASFILSDYVYKQERVQEQFSAQLTKSFTEASTAPIPKSQEAFVFQMLEKMFTENKDLIFNIAEMQEKQTNENSLLPGSCAKD